MGISSSLPTTILPSNIPSEPDSVFRKLDPDTEFRDRDSYDLSDRGEESDDIVLQFPYGSSWFSR